MILTKYGAIEASHFEEYKKSVINRIYAILPMKEEEVETIAEYINILNRELLSNLEVFNECEKVISVVCVLDSIIAEQEHSVYRRAILNCCNTIARLGDSNV